MHFLNMFFFDIYPYIAGSVFLMVAGCVMTTVSIPGAPRPARCWIARG
ncbi:respiratory nitrate reductase 1 subunit gamma [Citrobacter amalonaticus]|nr:respiratory nitrate reductase 1 subunit gamma [Citrobacter amalonaticus]